MNTKYRRHTDPNGRYDQNEIKRNKRKPSRLFKISNTRFIIVRITGTDLCDGRSYLSANLCSFLGALRLLKPPSYTGYKAHGRSDLLNDNLLTKV